jgi:6-phosphogluconolactonase (cycloisomerase 2 family)
LSLPAAVGRHRRASERHARAARLAAESANPTFFGIDLKRRSLFAENEIDRFEGKPGRAVSAFAIGDTGMLGLINQRASMGRRRAICSSRPKQGEREK